MKRLKPGEVPKLSEAHIQETCCDFLRAEGWRILVTDPVSKPEWSKYFGERGMADVLALRYGHMTETRLAYDESEEILWIEFKRRSGRYAARQDEWHRDERARGADTWKMGEDFPASIEGFIEHYRGSRYQ